MDAPQVLVIGAGGIGCELLKTLLLSSITNIIVIDLDTIDKTNLNRQFLFTSADIGQPKALIAAKTLLSLRPSSHVTGMVADVCSLKAEFFAPFAVVFNALDNLRARRYVNRMCVFLKKPLIDAGTKGKLGQVSVHVPGVTACYDCESKPVPKQYAVCTIRSKPTAPEHCVAWAKYVYEALYGPEDPSNILSDLKISKNSDPAALFSALFVNELPENAQPITFPSEISQAFCNEKKTPTNTDELISSFVCSIEGMKNWPIKKFDKNDKVAVQFISAISNLRAANFGIPFKSPFEIQEIAGNIIPAVASTNSTIAALQVIEGLKLLKGLTTNGSVWLHEHLTYNKLIVPSSRQPPSQSVSKT
jgi:ubiquitin-like 1-activating enzyme E1 B